MTLDAETRKRLLRRLKPDHFFAERHRAVFAGLQEMTARGLEFDPAVLARYAPDVDVRFLEQIAESRGEAPPNLDHHVDTLLWDHKRAQAAEGPVAAFLAGLQNPRESPARMRALARLVGQAFEDAQSKAPFLRDTDAVVGEMMATLRRRVEGEAFFPFGIEGLDAGEDGVRRLRPGAAPGLVTVLTGMSGAGKTTTAGHMILGQVRQRRRVLVGAWEVRAPMTLELVTTLSLGWSRSRILDGRNQRVDTAMTREEMEVFEQRARELAPYIVFVDNPFRRGSVRKSGRVTNDDYLDILEEHVEASGAAVALFDLFDRCLRDRRPDDEQEALWRLLEMTDAHQIHTVVVHQQNLKGDHVRRDNRPSLPGLKGSSAYVDVGATIVAPHIPARFKNVPDDKFELHVLKTRFGPPFGLEFDWDPDTGQVWGGRDFGRDELFDDGADGATTPRMGKKPQRKGPRS